MLQPNLTRISKIQVCLSMHDQISRTAPSKHKRDEGILTVTHEELNSGKCH